jgi:hypothetical protein
MVGELGLKVNGRLLREQRAVETGEQTEPKLMPRRTGDFGLAMMIYVFRHFSVNGSKSLVMDELL